MIDAEQFAKERPVVLGFSNWEGTLFVPEANSTADMKEFFQAQFPNLEQQDYDKLNALYVNLSKTQPVVTAKHSPYFYELARAVGDVTFSCPTLDFSRAMVRSGGTSYLWRDNIRDTVEVAAGYIVSHTWELQAVWGPEYAPQYLALPGADSYEPGGVNHGLVGIIQRYWTNVARSRSPNLPNFDSLPEWDTYAGGKRLRVQTNATGMEEIPSIDLERCKFWSSISARTRV